MNDGHLKIDIETVDNYSPKLRVAAVVTVFALLICMILDTRETIGGVE